MACQPAPLTEADTEDRILNGAAHDGAEGDELRGWPTRGMSEEQKLTYLQSHINIFVERQRLEVALAPEDIGGLPEMRRWRALRNSLLVAAARHCRQNPNADTGLAILIYLTLLADNPEGICWLSQRRMERILGRRSAETIVSNIERLEKDGQIGVIRKNRAVSGYWPLVHPDLVTLDPHPATLAKALSRPNCSTIAEQIPAETALPTQSSVQGQTALPTPANCSTNAPPTALPTPAHKTLTYTPTSTTAARERRSRGSTADENRTRKKRAKARTQLVPKWEPTNEQVAWVKCRWQATDGQISTEAERFRAYHKAKGSLMADWVAAWRTWWLNDYHKIPRRPQGGSTTTQPATPPPDLDDRSGAYHAVLKRRVGAEVYGSWMTSLRIDERDGDRLTVSVSTPFVRNWVDQKYRDALVEAARSAVSPAVQRVDVTVREATP